MIKVGIVGGTGYTGVELLRLLAGHPNTELVAITSRSEKGKPVSDCLRPQTVQANTLVDVTDQKTHRTSDIPS